MGLFISAVLILMAFLPNKTTIQPYKQASFLSALENDTIYIPTTMKKSNKAIWEIAQGLQQAGYKNKGIWIDLKDNTVINDFENYFKIHAEAFGLREEDEMRLVSKDDKYAEYQQYYKGIEVDGGGYVITAPSLHIPMYRITGRFYEHLNINITPQLTKEAVVKILTDSIKAEKYIWEDERLCGIWKDAGKSCDPVVKLVIDNSKYSFEPAFFHLTYETIIITGGQDPIGYRCNVDASTGKINLLHNGRQHCGTTGTVHTQHHGMQDFTIQKIAGTPVVFGLANNCPTNGDWIIAKPYSSWGTPSCPKRLFGSLLVMLVLLCMIITMYFLTLKKSLTSKRKFFLKNIH
jgi:hypothetical protein